MCLKVSYSTLEKKKLNGKWQGLVLESISFKFVTNLSEKNLCKIKELYITNFTFHFISAFIQEILYFTVFLEKEQGTIVYINRPKKILV
jgi:hypothetical protein